MEPIVWSNMLDELLEDEDDSMTQWEVEFIESMAAQREAGRKTNSSYRPSLKQEQKIREIWDRIFK